MKFDRITSGEKQALNKLILTCPSLWLLQVVDVSCKKIEKQHLYDVVFDNYLTRGYMPTGEYCPI